MGRAPKAPGEASPPSPLKQALRNNKIECMPPESDRSKNEILGGHCRKYLSDNRADLKKPLKKSVEQHEEMLGNGTFVLGDSELNIGHVALEVFKGHKDVHPTPAHLARLAWLRHLIANKKVSAGESFWDDVDKKLAELRESARKNNPSNPRAYTDRVFKAILDKDQQTYGTAKLDCLTTLTELPEWQRNVEDIAGKL
ncbi:hypothetical protein FRC01_004437 [Tulasnella sp. 417]|nr:hypothetical protein FRC01_004437 [Tulasnella sp. 417]